MVVGARTDMGTVPASYRHICHRHSHHDLAQQMTYLKRRKPKRSGIERTPRRRYPAHLKFVRGFMCAVPDCGALDIEAAHARKGTDGGMGEKPSDWLSLPLCTECHKWQHTIGERRFEEATGIDMKKIATELARRSPVQEVREMAGKKL